MWEIEILYVERCVYSIMILFRDAMKRKKKLDEIRIRARDLAAIKFPYFVEYLA